MCDTAWVDLVLFEGTAANGGYYALVHFVGGGMGVLRNGQLMPWDLALAEMEYSGLAFDFGPLPNPEPAGGFRWPHVERWDPT